MPKSVDKQEYRDPDVGPTLSPRFILALLLVVLGIAWIVYYYVVVRVDASVVPEPRAGGPSVFETLTDWKGVNWNYVGGFGLLLLGLALSANPRTPLGRGRGVVIGMLGCFLIGLIWVVVFYFVGTETKIPLMSSLGQKNLVLGVAFMAVGFAFATKWE